MRAGVVHVYRSLAAAFALTSSLACGSSTTGSEGSNDLDASSGAAVAADAAPEAGGPDASPYFEGEKYVLAGSHANIVRRMGFIGLTGPGVARGFDLDGRVSPAGERESCGHGDLTDPEGRTGIDNQLASIWATLEPLVGPQVAALLQGAINEGRVLVMMELSGVDDLRDDPDVTFRLFRGVLRPEVGTQGYITPDQTFAFDYENPVSTVSNVAIVDGELVAGPVVLQVPIAILDLDIIADIELGRIRVRIAEDGTFSGYIGGALSLPKIIGALLETGASAETRLVQPIFERNADMEPVDGKCTYISVGLEFDGTTAFVVRDAARE
jgi:hypothetical protein